MNKKYPFTYIGEGCSYFEDYFQCCIWFQNEISLKEKENIMSSLPLPPQIFSLYTANSQALFFLGEENCEFTIKELLNPEFKKLLELDAKGQCEIDIWGKEERFLPDAEEWKSFDEKITQWLLEIHKIAPIAFVYKPAKILKDFDEKHYGVYSKWHDESLENIPEVVSSKIKDFYKNPPEDKILNERVLWVATKLLGAYLKIKKSPSEFRGKIRELIDLASLLCEYDGVEEINGYDSAERIIFDNGELLEKIIKKMPEKERVKTIAELSPYAQLTLFSGTDTFCYLLLFENPFEYLQSLLEKIPSSRKKILSRLVCQVMMLIRIYWRDKKPQEENKEFLLKLADLVLKLSYVRSYSYMRTEMVFLEYEAWEKVLDLYSDGNYLLAHSEPVNQLMTVLEKIPKTIPRAATIRKIAENIANCKKSKEELGFKHDLKSISEQILALK